VTDPEIESRFNFSLEESLRRASQRRLLENYSVYVTPKVEPKIEIIRNLVETAGGKVSSFALLFSILPFKQIKFTAIDCESNYLDD
jgi:hypothetical protein